MKADLEDALVPVAWARAQIPVLQERFLSWQRSYPYKLVCEPEWGRPDRELLVAPETAPNFPIREKSSDFFKRGFK